jgi:hypothetical protein
VHPDIEELWPKLKEILYDCAVEIRATKAALYLFSSEQKAELVTEYGFRGSARPLADRNDPMLDRCGRGRTPFFVNGLAAEPVFAELLYNSGSEYLLVAPIYSRGALVGMIDIRDKAQKQPFDQADVTKAQKIVDRIAALFYNKNVFGQRFLVLSDASGLAEPQAASIPTNEPHPATFAPAPAASAGLPQVTARPAPAQPVPPAPKGIASAPAAAVSAREGSTPRSHVPRLATLVLEARTAAGRLTASPLPESIGEAELVAIRDLLRSILLIPSAIVATFSAFGQLGGVQEVAARSSIGEDGVHFLQSKLNVWLRKRGEVGGFVRTNVTTPFGTSAQGITSVQMKKVFTAPVKAGSIEGLYLTVAFNTVPERSTHELLAAFLVQLQLAIEHSMRRDAVRTLRARAAEKLLEPDLTKYPDLRRHSQEVVKCVESFARYLTLGSEDSETLRLAAVVHDAGMRMLDYERLYRKKDLSGDELGILREHPSVGAVMVEPLLGSDVARVVLCHHERVDGRGYPNELGGHEIPLASRILQICDAWVAMTDADSYQPAESAEGAISIIARGAGSQFDSDLAKKFVEMVRKR